MEIIYFAFTRLLLPLNVLAMFLGMSSGILIGSLPDISPSIGMALLLPVVVSLPPETALITLAAIYFGSFFGGSISAIICRIPGIRASAITVLDGYQMTLRGKGIQAIGVACVSSVFGGVLSSLALFFLAGKVAKIELYFSGADRFWLLIMAVSVIAAFGSKSFTRGVMSGLAGIILAMFNREPITDAIRMPLPVPALENGFPLSVIVIGIFGLAPVIAMGEVRLRRRAKPYPLKGHLCPPKWEIVPLFITMIYAWVNGFLVGVLPGTGAAIGARLAYRAARERSENSFMFGRGSTEGVAAAESGNNAATGGALIPTLALGIPGDASTTILLAGIYMLGLSPGLKLFGENETLTYTFLLGCIFVHVFMLGLGLLGYRFFAKTVTIPERVLLPLMTVSAVIGVYVIRNEFIDMVLVIPFALLGYFMRKFALKPTAFITAFLLTPHAEAAFRLTLDEGGILNLFATPLSKVFIVFSISLLVVPLFFDHFRKQMSIRVGAETNFRD